MNKEYLEVKHFLCLKLELGFGIVTIVYIISAKSMVNQQEQAAKEAAAAGAKVAHKARLGNLYEDNTEWETGEAVKPKKVEEWFQIILIAPF